MDSLFINLLNLPLTASPSPLPSPPNTPTPQPPWNGLRARELHLTISLLTTSIHARERLLDAELINLAANPPPDGDYDDRLLQKFKVIIEELKECLEDTEEELRGLEESWRRVQRMREGFYREATRARCVPFLEEGMVEFMRGKEGGGLEGLDLWTRNARRALEGGGVVRAMRQSPESESSDEESGSKGKGKAPVVNFSRRDLKDPAPLEKEPALTGLGPIVRDFAYSSARQEEPRPSAKDGIFEEYLGDVMHRMPKAEEVVDLSGAHVREGDAELARPMEDIVEAKKRNPGLRERNGFLFYERDDD